MKNSNFKLLALQQKIIRKIINILSGKLVYYEETETFPEEAYPAKLDLNFQKNLLEKFSKNDDNFSRYPGVVCPYLGAILSVLYADEKFKLLDFGARNIDHYAHLIKNLPRMEYYYFDLPQYNAVIAELKKQKKLKNLFVFPQLSQTGTVSVDFIFLGSVLQYIKDYKNILSQLFDLEPGYILISGQVCYEKKIDNSETVFYKQLNVLPQINYGQFFHYESLVKLFDKRGWKLISQTLNTTDKNINFNHFSKKYGNIEYLDLLFKKK